MTAASPETIVAALDAALDAPVYWGWAPFQAVETPPSYPLVTVHRALFTAEGFADMCVDDQFIGDTTLAVHTWSPVYEEARTLMTLVRPVMLEAGGWTLQTETDSYEPNARAWQVEAMWLAVGIAAD